MKIRGKGELPYTFVGIGQYSDMTSRSLSLIEQKKIQWKKEREEMAKFFGLWTPSAYNNYQRKISDSCLASLSKMRESQELEQCCTINKCLPPIQKSQNTQPENCKEKSEYDTSGYGSETDFKELPQHEKIKQWKSQSSLYSDSTHSLPNNYSGDDMASRMRWGDRGVGVGHLWAPTNNVESRLPEIVQRPGTPHWLQRSLVNNSEVDFNNNYDSEATSRSSQDKRMQNKSHIRGQNVPIEPETMLEREQKRLKAIELHEAIKQQLQERENKRKREKEQEMEDEKKLEQKVKLYQEIEKKRLEEELRKQREKDEKENRKTRAMIDAIETAEKMAKAAKCKAKRVPQNGVDVENRNFIRDQTPFELRPNEVDELTFKFDVSTSLTFDEYFDHFKSLEPFVRRSNADKETQTNCHSAPLKNSKLKRKSSKIIDRPKWGVNMPRAKYVKQSEKDPFYERKFKFSKNQFETERSFSSRSQYSTDESKSLSSSPNEREFKHDTKWHLKAKKAVLADTETDPNLDAKDDESTEREKKSLLDDVMVD